MLIVIAGGTGFLGQALQRHLAASGHTIRLLTRSGRGKQADAVEWRPDGTVGTWSSIVHDADAVINLAGAGIADRRWTDARKATLRDSRILATRSLVTAIKRAPRKPAVLVNASGVGYYGNRGSELVTEETGAGDDFLARLCVEWEREAEQAAGDTRVVVLRNGLVLHPSGGALGKMLLPFRFGVGGRLGTGAQYLPWIHLDDWLGLTTTLISHADASGPFNLSAPHPASNAEFTRAMGAALHRPAVLPVPGIALRIALGELADTLLTGQRAVPRRAEQMGFHFRFRDIQSALRDLLQR